MSRDDIARFKAVAGLANLTVDFDACARNELSGKRTRTIRHAFGKKYVDSDAAASGIRQEGKVTAAGHDGEPKVQAASWEKSDSISEMMVFSSVFLAFDSSLTSSTWAVS